MGRHIYFIHNAPQLTQDYPDITNAKDARRDFVQFSRAIFGCLTNREVFTLPSGALTPSILAGELLRAADQATLFRQNSIMGIDIGLARMEAGMPPRSPYEISPQITPHHKMILSEQAKTILHNIIANPRDNHVIMESVPGGTVTAITRCERVGVKVSREISSLHPVDDYDRYTARNATLDLLRESHSFDEMDDFAEIIQGISRVLKEFDGSPTIDLSGGLMAAAAISPKLNNPRYNHCGFRIHSNPIFFAPITPDYRHELSVYEYQVKVNSRGLQELRDVLRDFPFTRPYLNGRVGEGAGLGYGMTQFAEAAANNYQCVEYLRNSLWAISEKIAFSNKELLDA